MKWLRRLFFALALTIALGGLFAQIPYLLFSWKHSPMERYDWIWILLTLLAGGVTSRALYQASRDTATRREWFWLAATLAGVGLAGVGFFREIHFFQLTGNLAVLFGLCWGLTGWQMAYRYLPLWGILLFRLPSVGYQLSKLEPLSGFPPEWVKGLPCAMLAVWFLWNVWQRKHVAPPAERVLFCGCVIFGMLGIGVCQVTPPVKTGAPFLPDFNCFMGADFLGVELDLNASEAKFFRNVQAHKYHYTTEHLILTIWALHASGNVHQLHPPGHCLRVNGFQVSSEQTIPVTLNQEQLLYVNELRAWRDGHKFLVWNWFSDPQRSTSSFLYFRRNYRSDSKSRSYQLLVNLDEEEELESVRAELQLFLQQIQQEQTVPIFPAPDRK